MKNLYDEILNEIITECPDIDYGWAQELAGLEVEALEWAEDHPDGVGSTREVEL